MLTEKSLDGLLESGTKLFEIFLNTFSETEPDYLDRLKYSCDVHGAEIVSIHPFTSAYESYLLFSGYERRFCDGVKLYDIYFRTAKRIGAKYTVLHGMQKKYSSIDEKEYFRRFAILRDEGKNYGITLLQENVWEHLSGNMDFIKHMKDELGKDAGFVLDTKQARRCGYDPSEAAVLFGENLRHIHVSDYSGNELCTLPGTGEFNFRHFFQTLDDIGYKGDAVIEVYGNSEHDIPALIKSMNYLNNILQN